MKSEILINPLTSLYNEQKLLEETESLLIAHIKFAVCGGTFSAGTLD